MESGNIKPKVEVHEAEILVNPDLLGDAVDGENREHEMSVWAAAKTYPWACLWAFIMCFTIVSLPCLTFFPFVQNTQLMPIT